MNSFIEFGSVMIAGFSALLAYFAARQSRISAENSANASQSIAEATLTISKAQHQLYQNEVQLQYYAALRAWADQSLDIVSELICLCKLDPIKTTFNYAEKHVSVLNKLSSLIDRGRWFFPNQQRDQKGQDKDLAFQGFRHPALDQLVYSFNTGVKIEYTDIATNEPCHCELKKYRRQFTSIIQAVIGSDEWVSILEAMREK